MQVKEASLVAYRKIVERTRSKAGFFLYYNEFSCDAVAERAAGASEMQFTIHSARARARAALRRCLA